MYRLYLFLYNVVLHLVIFVAFFYFAIRYREGLSERLGKVVLPPKKNKRIWIHAVSVGEVVAASHLLRRLKERFDGDVVISTTTTTGMQTVRRLNLPVSFSFYYPVDLPFAVRRVVKAVSPDVMIFVETEWWPNIIETLGKRGVPLVVINGRLSVGSFRRYRWVRPLVMGMLRRFSLLCMISSRDAWRVVSLGAVPRLVRVMGNLKYGATLWRMGSSDVSGVKEWLNLRGDELVWVAGSTHRGEEDVVLDVFERLKQKYSRLLLVLCPRHPERGEEVFRLAERRGFGVVRRSSLIRRSSDVDVVVVDTVGELFDIYGVATVVFCGGSLVPKGGQNIVEPAVWGKPVLHGEYMEDFSMEAESLEGRGAFTVRDGEEMFALMDELLGDERKRVALGGEAREVVKRWATGVDECIIEVGKLLRRR